PVVAAAVVLPLDIDATWLGKVRDSKQLTATARQRLFRYIYQDAVAVGVGCTDSDDIDRIGIVPATRRAMRLAVESLAPPPEAVLIDYMTVPEIGLPQKGITGGDRLCLSIACASIVAKVTRDRMMASLDATYPGYGFARHKGYCTRQHVACLERLGPCPIHRRSFRPVRAVIRQ
ncbi:MAG: ribonuclease HII, partial [Dehalococcoidales bacterium]